MDNANKNKDTNASYDAHLKGTFISVLFIGIVVFLTWLAVFYMYIVTV